MKKILHILIPIAEHEFLPSSVIRGLSLIEIPYRLFLSMNEVTGRDRIFDITENRNKLSIRAGGWYNLLLDSDVELQKWVVPEMVAYLDTYSQVGVISVLTRGRIQTGVNLMNHEHVPIACAMVRSDILKKIPFRYKSNDLCECYNFTKDVRTFGYESHILYREGIGEIKRV